MTSILVSSLTSLIINTTAYLQLDFFSPSLYPKESSALSTMDYTSTAGAIACAAAWAISSRPLTPTLPTKNTEDPDSISTCPVSGHRVDEMSGRQTKCPFSRCVWVSAARLLQHIETWTLTLIYSTPLLSTCDPSIGTGELDIPDVPPLTEAQKDIIKSTAPVLGVHGVTITTHFCESCLLYPATRKCSPSPWALTMSR